MRHRVVAVLLTASILVLGNGVAVAQPQDTPPTPPTTEQLSPQNPGGRDNGEEIPIQDPKTGGVRWDQFGGDPAGAPQDLDSFIDTALGWLRTAALYAGVLGLLCCAGLMAIGIQGRSEPARKAMIAIPYVLAGAVMSGSSGVILSAFI